MRTGNSDGLRLRVVFEAETATGHQQLEGMDGRRRRVYWAEDGIRLQHESWGTA